MFKDCTFALLIFFYPSLMKLETCLSSIQTVEEVARHCSECDSPPSWMRGVGREKGEKKECKPEKQEQMVKKRGTSKKELLGIHGEIHGEKHGVATLVARGHLQVNVDENEDNKKEVKKKENTRIEKKGDVKKVVQKEKEAKVIKSCLEDGLLPEEERGLMTPLAPRPGAGGASRGEGRGEEEREAKRCVS